MFASIVWDVDPTIFEIAGREIRWYGLMWAVGFILAYKYAECVFRKEKRPEEWTDRLFVYSMVGVIDWERDIKNYGKKRKIFGESRLN